MAIGANFVEPGRIRGIEAGLGRFLCCLRQAFDVAEFKLGVGQARSEFEMQEGAAANAHVDVVFNLWRDPEQGR